MDMIPVSSSNIAAIGWEVEPPHDCGLCDGPLTFVRMERGAPYYECAECAKDGNGHFAIDCCENEGRPVLVVEFKNGRTYRYFDVPEDTFEQLKGSSSVGSAFATLVRNAGYEYEQQ